MLAVIAVVCFLATIPAANWMIGNVGACSPGGPCLIPVGFGLMAPSGVLLIGLAFVARDLAQRLAGPVWILVAITLGCAISFLVAVPSLAIASAVAFALSELADMAIYTPLARRRFIAAVAASSIAGAAIDSAIFLFLAFGSLDYLAGQLLGKVWMIAAASLFLIAVRRRVAA